MIKSKRVVFAVSLFCAMMFPVLVLDGCDNGTSITAETSGAMTGYSGCRDDSSDSGQDNSNEKCLEFNYDGQGNLQLVHVDATFNCCPGEIYAEIDIDGVDIMITEFEREAACYCRCTYNLEFYFSDLKPGIYHFTVQTPYDKNFDFDIDLRTKGYTRYCNP